MRVRRRFPPLVPLGQLLREWNPDDTEEPANYLGDSLQRLDYHTQQAESAELRQAEVRLCFLRCQPPAAECVHVSQVPFVVLGIPEVSRCVQKWTKDYLFEKFEDADAKVNSNALSSS